MQVDHLETARRAYDLAQLPLQPRSPAQALVYITRLLELLPASERAGYDGKPGGDNIAPLPDGTMVSISRVCYPDGQLYKVMGDAPNGGPQWVDNGLLPGGQAYIPFAGAVGTGGTPAPIDLSWLEHQVAALITANTELRVLVTELAAKLELKAESTRVEAINERMNAIDKISVKYPLPFYEGNAPLFGGRVVSQPRKP